MKDDIKMNDILLSIIIPVYNAEKYINECLLSLSDFSDSEIEIIVINDGSTDGTAAVVRECIAKNSHISLFSVPNGGVSKARNLGINYSKGKYIMFLDADDYLLSNAFQDVIKALQNDYDFSAFSRVIVDNKGNKTESNFPFKGKICNDKKIIDRYMFTDSLFNECWGKLYKKSIITEYNIQFPVGIPIGEDAMFVMEYYSHCNSVTTYNIPLVAYREHENSTIRNKNIHERLKYTDILYEYAKAYIPDELKVNVHFYNFKVITNLCREYSYKGIDPKIIETIYNSDITSKIMAELNYNDIPLYRKHEYILLKYKLFFLSAFYYHFKSKLS